MDNKNFKSLDGSIDDTFKYQKVKKLYKIKSKHLSIIGKGNSISAIPFSKKSTLIEMINNKEIKLDENKSILSVTANFTAYETHNYLLKNKYFFPSFPSYPNVTIGACVANCTHGITPRMGVMNKFVEEIKIFNPNFGLKTLSKKKNKELFDLTIGGMGITGIIIEVKLRVFKLKSSYIKISKKKKIYNLLDCYKFLKKNNYIYNQNNIFIKTNPKKKTVGYFYSGNFYGSKYSNKKLKISKIKKLRLGLLKFNIFRTILEKLLIVKEYILSTNILHINEAFYPSNSRLLYFNLMPKRFIEHQTIIPHKNVKKFFYDFEKLSYNYSPKITLCHLKIFNGKGKNLQFNSSGLGFTLHIVVDDNFEKFYKKFLKLNLINSCLINLYKNSFISSEEVRNFYKKKFYIFRNKVNKINKNYLFENNLFNKKNFYK